MKIWRLFSFALATFSLVAQEVVERGPHHNILEWVRSEQEGNETVYFTNQVTQLGSGLNFWNDESNAWAPSSDLIELLETGAVYRQGQFKLLFSSNVNDVNGALQWFPGAEQRVVIQTVGLAVTEEGTGDSVWLGQIKDTQGFLTAPNEITYPSCFENVDASIRIRVRHYGFESDVVLHEQLADVGFQGAARLEVWHRFVSGPEPELRAGAIQRSANKADSDVTLDFGPMIIGAGSAFLVGPKHEKLSGEGTGDIPVAKEYFVDPDSGARFLIESLPLTVAAPALQTLPAREQAFHLSPDLKNQLQASRGKNHQRRRPIAAVTTQAPEARRVAAISRHTLPARGGLLLDYVSLVNQTNQILAGNVTYLVASNSVVNLSGHTVLEPGCVIKFGQNDAANTTPVINILGTFECQTRPYAPAVFTSREDRTVGEANTALTASINTNASYGAFHLNFAPTGADGISLHNVRSLYAYKSFGFDATNSVDLWNVQAYSISSNVFQSKGLTNRIRNVLAHYVKNVVVPTGHSVGFTGEHFTVHTASKTFFDDGKTNCTFGLVNPLLIGVTNSSSSGFTTSGGATNASDSGIFQSVGSGAHYLADHSPYRNAGSTNISTNLTVGIFPHSTTHPPVILSNTISVNTTLSRLVFRDVDVPDLGYHYPALDWAVSGLNVTNATLIITNGAAVAYYGEEGFKLRTGSKFFSEGKPLHLNRLVRYDTVQEQPVKWGVGSAISQVTINDTITDVWFRLTESTHLANVDSKIVYQNGGYPTAFTLRDCEIYNAYLNYANGLGSSSTVGITNSLFHRSNLTLRQGTSGSAPVTLEFRNSLLRFSPMLVTYFNPSWPWTFKDNLFDNSAVSHSGGNVEASFSYNGKRNSSVPGGTGDKTIASTDYQIGVQGRWYYPASGTNLFSLVDVGSRTAANAGLYHYTTRTDHTKDSSTVDIGFHYVSTDATGPVDSDGDGLADYWEDVDGDGVSDTGESPWTYPINNLSNLTVFTPLQP